MISFSQLTHQVHLDLGLELVMATAQLGKEQEK